MDNLPRRGGNPAMVKGGPSLNPKGRPRTGMAFAEEVRRLCNPTELIEIALSIARGQPLIRAIDLSSGKVVLKREGEEMGDLTVKEIVWPSIGEVQSALTFLRDSGYFKPPTALTINAGGDSGQERDYSLLSDEELDKAIELDEIAAGKRTKPVLDAVSREQKDPTPR